MNEAMHAPRTPSATGGSVHVVTLMTRTSSLLASFVYPWCADAVLSGDLSLTRSAVSANFGLILAEMAHQSPYRTEVLFLSILAYHIKMCLEMVSKMCQFWHVNTCLDSKGVASPALFTSVLTFSGHLTEVGTSACLPV